jgi:RND family efflux transporter MFP subunit
LEQEKIDVTRAVPVSEQSATPQRPVRRGAPIWLQLILTLVVLVIALGVAGLFLPSANAMLANVGVRLPLLNSAAGPAAAPQAQAKGQAQGTRQGQGTGQGAGARGGAGAGGSRVAVVVAAAATTGIINNKLTSIGEGVAVKSVTVNPQSAGTLMSVDVKAGDAVKAGTKLATLDAGTQQIAYDKAMLASQDADAALVRAQALSKTQALSDSQLATAQLASAQAKLAVSDAKLTLDQRTITTPVDGIVGLIQVTPGNLVSTQTVVTTIEDASQILVNFWVPERYSGQMSVNLPAAAESDALPGRTFNGTIDAVDNKIDPTSRTLQVQATLPNTDGTIKPGMSFTVDMSFPGETFPDVDPLSIQWSNTGAYVWKVVDGKVVKGMVEIIQRNSDGVLVKGDVKPGDQIVTQGVLQLTDNAPVRLLDAGAAAAQNKPASGDAAASAPAGQASSQPAASSQG